MRPATLTIVFMLIGAGARGEDVGATLIDCLIAPHTTMRLSTPVEGQLASLSVDRGDRVEAGQVVATLEATVERAQYELSQARLAYDQRRLARIEGMFAQEVISVQQLDDVRRETRVSEKELERAAAVLERRVIRSPIDGVIVKRLLEPGEYSQPSEVLEIARTGALRVEAYAPAELFGRIAVGSQADVVAHTQGGSRVQAEVTVVDPVVDPGSGTFGVRLELSNEDGRLPAGIGCQVRFRPEPDLRATGG